MQVLPSKILFSTQHSQWISTQMPILDSPINRVGTLTAESHIVKSALGNLFYTLTEAYYLWLVIASSQIKYGLHQAICVLRLHKHDTIITRCYGKNFIRIPGNLRDPCFHLIEPSITQSSNSVTKCGLGRMT